MNKTQILLFALPTADVRMRLGPTLDDWVVRKAQARSKMATE